MRATFCVVTSLGTAIAFSLSMALLLGHAAQASPVMGDGANSGLVSAQVSAQELPVVVEYKGGYQGFFERPRLSVVLFRFYTDSQILWRQARLYHLSSPKQADINSLRDRVVTQLHAITRAQALDKKLAFEVSELSRFLVASRYASPVDVDLDPSAALVDSRQNPKLPAGRFLLVSPSSNRTAAFVGVGGVVYQPVAFSSPVWQLFHQSPVANAADYDEVWRIERSGAPTVIHVASWNRADVFANVGDLYFLPLAAHLLAEEQQDLNQQIAELLSYRIAE